MLCYNTSAIGRKQNALHSVRLARGGRVLRPREENQAVFELQKQCPRASSPRGASQTNDRLLLPYRLPVVTMALLVLQIVAAVKESIMKK